MIGSFLFHFASYAILMMQNTSMHSRSSVDFYEVHMSCAHCQCQSWLMFWRGDAHALSRDWFTSNVEVYGLRATHEKLTKLKEYAFLTRPKYIIHIASQALASPVPLRQPDPLVDSPASGGITDNVVPPDFWPGQARLYLRERKDTRQYLAETEG